MKPIAAGKDYLRFMRALSGNPGPTLAVTIPGRPVPWARTGGHGKRRYTPKKLREYEKQIALLTLGARRTYQTHHVKTLTSACALVMTSVYYTSNKGYWKDTVPDEDNLIKAVKDGLQKGGAVRDDSQFAVVLGSKVQLATEHERTEIEIWELLPR